MVIRITVEAIVYSLLYTAFMLVLFRIQGAKYLRAELRDAQSELALAYRQFDQATAPELVEACIYRISAAKARCDYYLRVLKAQEPEAAGSVRGDALWT